jgi:hypothetical protein
MTDADRAGEVLRRIADEVARVRREIAERVGQELEREAATIEQAGYDPARGRGRGAWWAVGGRP